MEKISFLIIFNTLAIIGAYFLLRLIYKNKDPRKWEPVLSTNKKDTKNDNKENDLNTPLIATIYILRLLKIIFIVLLLVLLYVNILR